MNMAVLEAPVKSGHRVDVVRVPEPIVHPNADKLEILHIGGFQCVVKKGDFTPGSLAIYIPPDSVVPQTSAFSFLWETKALDRNEFGEAIVVPEKYRRIKAIRLRKEWSEGLLMPISEFPELPLLFLEGDDMADILGITHYQPPEPDESLAGDNERFGKAKSRWPRSFRGWFYFILSFFGFEATRGINTSGPDQEPPVYDVDAYKHHTNLFKPSERVVITEKIHGANARFTYQNGKYYVGSRKLWKSKYAKCIWRTVAELYPTIELWCRTHEGYVLYGEVVPCQKFAGGKTANYGCKDGEVKFFLFDILTPDGEWVSSTI